MGMGMNWFGTIFFESKKNRQMKSTHEACIYFRLYFWNPLQNTYIIADTPLLPAATYMRTYAHG